MKAQEFINIMIAGTKQPKWWNYLLSAILFLFLLIQLFPYPLFTHKTCYRNTCVYSTQPIDSAIKKVLDSTYSILERSEIQKPALKHTVFLLENYDYAKFFGFTMYRAFGWNHYNRNKIFIVKTDIRKNTCFRNDSSYNERFLSEVLAHEIVHSLQREKLGLLSMTIAPTWKIEGYAEYISMPEIFNLNYAKQTLVKVQTDKSYAADYIRYKIAVQYLFNYKKYTFKKLTASPLNLTDVIEEIEGL